LGRSNLSVTNPTKLIFPDDGYTKADLVAHYELVGEAMVPHVIDRPLTLERYPNGIKTKGFMQKNASEHFPDFIGRVVLPKVDGTVSYPAVKGAEGLVYLANQGTVTFHIPSFRVQHLDRPDRVVFDLDPPAGAIALVRQAARNLKAILEAQGLHPLLMASGSKGYHLVIQVEPKFEFDRVSPWAHGVSAIAIEEHPEVFTEEFLIKNRGGKVFLDWMRNHWGATTVAPYSLRPRPGAPVAVPLDWSELDQLEPNSIKMPAIGERLAKDPWAGASIQDLTSSIEAVEARISEGRIVLRQFDRFGRR
jgi:bifunctional non-homologous end joining protein LigD